MPELPEVESVRRTLEPALVGRTIVDVEVVFAGSVSGLSPEAFRSRLLGERFAGMERYGKYLVFRFESGLYMSMHLRMTGRAVLSQKGEPIGPHDRVRFFLDDERELRFSDLRKFGRVGLAEREADLPNREALGPEPLTEQFTVDALRNALRGRTSVKAAILDQKRIAGLGNIYADESLFVAGIHPERKVDTLSAAEVERLHQAIEHCIADALAYGGTTFRDYVQGDGRPGGYAERLKVYGRHGQPCVKCGHSLERTRVAGRGTTFCPKCQR